MNAGVNDRSCAEICLNAIEKWNLQKAGRLNQPSTAPSPSDPAPAPAGAATPTPMNTTRQIPVIVLERIKS
jgi:hypothetical protein